MRTEKAAGGTDRGPLQAGDQFTLAFLLALLACAGCALLQGLLYLRPAPDGGPFLLEWRRYFGLALYYDLLGVWLLAFPFLLLWLALYRRRLTRPGWSAIPLIQALLLTLNLALSQFDHEVARFLGIRLTPSFLATYARPGTLSDSLFIDLLRADRGGPFLPLILFILVPAFYFGGAVRLIQRAMRRPFRAPPLWLAVPLALVPLLAPGNAWLQATGQFRLRKVEPVAIALAVDIRQGYQDFERPADLDRLADEYRSAWLARSTDRGWRFPDPHRPYLRVPIAAAPGPDEAARWNVIYLQLETFRGMDMGFLRPDRRPSPTPYLDRLSKRLDASVWTRAASFGMPSINGLFAAHCSITPHSRRYITAFTNAGFHCLPELLRRRGWRTEMFNGGDTDWDNSTPWLRRWYDRLWRFPEARQHDRAVFRAAAPRIRELGRSGQPFWATLVSVTNHTPFRSVEPAFDVAGSSTAAERILNTTRYTDDVVGEFLESLRHEPWFARTILVIAGDHGFNCGEHGQRAGQHDLYRESVWVPLIIAGGHPRLVPGFHHQPASLLDIAPTLADLLGLREANPWQGHSLLAVTGSGATAFAAGGAMMFDSGRWSAVLDPRDDRPRLYDTRTDWLQRHDLAKRHPALAAQLLAKSERAARLNDYVLRHDRIWPTR
ncbi:MAG TPA: sulfatase-like hydrolase/transferase [Allosphingosinicella sp.]|nr:sulfatase-like hydrolase/transferase [Allosphingosinicella sp.]